MHSLALWAPRADCDLVPFIFKRMQTSPTHQRLDSTKRGKMCISDLGTNCSFNCLVSSWPAGLRFLQCDQGWRSSRLFTEVGEHQMKPRYWSSFKYISIWVEFLKDADMVGLNLKYVKKKKKNVKKRHTSSKAVLFNWQLRFSFKFAFWNLLHGRLWRISMQQMNKLRRCDPARISATAGSQSSQRDLSLFTHLCFFSSLSTAHTRRHVYESTSGLEAVQRVDHEYWQQDCAFLKEVKGRTTQKKWSQVVYQPRVRQ